MFKWQRLYAANPAISTILRRSSRQHGKSPTLTETDHLHLTLLQAAPEQYEAFLPFGQAPFNNSIETNPYFFYLSSQASWSRPPDTLSLLQ